jgi:4-amino-4-deoxy-L-arabinose transferase-like glycosyltransferase
MQITGESAIIIQTMRLVLYVFLCGSLWLVYVITKKIFDSKRSGCLGVLLILTNLVWIWESFDIRPDNIMVFFALLSFWFVMQLYEKIRIAPLVMFAFCAGFSMLGKQNAAIFYFGLMIGFIYDIFFIRKKLSIKVVICLIVGLLVVFQVDFFKNFLTLNIKRHLIPDDIKFWPTENILAVWSFNPSVFLLFILQFFTGNTLSQKYRGLKIYLTSVCVNCFLFLFLMNRPFHQEMLLMIVFMSILASGFLLNILENVDKRLVYVVLGIIVLPGLIYIPYSALRYPISNDLEVTACILDISEKDDLVFDSYGQAIFRHHPLEPKYLVYFPKKFKRLDELKKSKVKFLIKDRFYFSDLPAETLNWFEKNFVQTVQNPNIFVRINNLPWK